MGTGIDMARADAPEHAEVMDNMKDQLLLVLVKRLGGDITIPVSEIDDTGQDLMEMQLVDGPAFRFVMSKKS